METDQRPGCLNSLDNSYAYPYQPPKLWGTLQAGADKEWQAIFISNAFLFLGL